MKNANYQKNKQVRSVLNLTKFYKDFFKNKGNQIPIQRNNMKKSYSFVNLWIDSYVFLCFLCVLYRR